MALKKTYGNKCKTFFWLQYDFTKEVPEKSPLIVKNAWKKSPLIVENAWEKSPRIVENAWKKKECLQPWLQYTDP